MKSIEEFNVSGKFGTHSIKGKVSTYPKNLRNAINNGVKTSILSSWNNHKQTLSSQINIKVFNKELVKKISLLVLVGGITITSLTGCQINPNAKTNETTISNELSELDITIQYQVKSGDSLWKIAEKYTNPANIQNEIYKICIINNIRENDILLEGTTISLEIPVKNLNQFEAEYEDIKWDAKEQFVFNAFDLPEDKVHPDNQYFWTTKENIQQLLIKASAAKDSLLEMKSMTELYSKEKIAEKKNEIDSIYEEAIEITEQVTNKSFTLEQAIIDHSKKTNEKSNEQKAK